MTAPGNGGRPLGGPCRCLHRENERGPGHARSAGMGHGDKGPRAGWAKELRDDPSPDRNLRPGRQNLFSLQDIKKFMSGEQKWPRMPVPKFAARCRMTLGSFRRDSLEEAWHPRPMRVRERSVLEPWAFRDDKGSARPSIGGPVRKMAKERASTDRQLSDDRPRPEGRRRRHRPSSCRAAARSPLQIGTEVLKPGEGGGRRGLNRQCNAHLGSRCRQRSTRLYRGPAGQTVRGQERPTRGGP